MTAHCDFRLLLPISAIRARLANVADLFARVTNDNLSVEREPSLRQSLQILLRRFRPCLCHFGATGLRRKLNAHNVFLLGLALKVDDAVRLRNSLLRGDQVRVHLVITEDGLQLRERDGRIGLCVAENVHLDLVHVTLFVCFLEEFPGLLHWKILDAKAREIEENAIYGAGGRFVTFSVAYAAFLKGTVNSSMAGLLADPAGSVKWPLNGRVGAFSLRVSGLITVEAPALLSMLRHVLLSEFSGERGLISAIVPLSEGASGVISLPRVGVGSWDARQWAVLLLEEVRHSPLSAAVQLSTPIMNCWATWRFEGFVMKGRRTVRQTVRGRVSMSCRTRVEKQKVFRNRKKNSACACAREIKRERVHAEGGYKRKERCSC